MVVVATQIFFKISPLYIGKWSNFWPDILQMGWLKPPTSFELFWFGGKVNNCEWIGRRIEGIFNHKGELAEIAAGISVWINFAETGARVDHIYFEFNNSITQGGFTVPRRENSQENLAPQRVGAHGFRGNARCGAFPQHFSNPRHCQKHLLPTHCHTFPKTSWDFYEMF